MRHNLSSSSGKRHTWLLLVLAGGLFAGCGPLSDARKSMQAGNSLAAVSAYQQALAQRPNDAAIRRELEVAQSDAAATLASQSRQRLAVGDYQTAVRLGENAAQLDPQYGPLAEDARRAMARDHLARAEANLDAGHFAEARQSARAARETARDLAEPIAILAKIDSREADALNSQISTLLSAGDFTNAARIAERIAKLQPGEQAMAGIEAEVDRRRREAAFDRMYVQAEASLTDGQLHAAADSLAALTALNVRETELEHLHDALGARLDQLDDRIIAARDHRDQGRFSAALISYDEALAIVSDRPQLAAEREACAARADAEARRIAGADALDRGDERTAIDLLTQSQRALPDARTRTLLNRANAAWHGRQMDMALDADDYSQAIDHGIELLTLEPSDELTSMLDQLRDRLIDEALRTASQMHASGSTFQARSTLETAMQRVSSIALDEMHGELRAEELLQEAVAAETRGRYEQARSLYLSALAAGGDRAAIESRIDDTAVLSAMQNDMQAAQREASDLHNQVGSLHAALNDRERAIHELERVADALSYDISCLQRDNSALSHQLYSLKHEIDRLCSQIRHLENERDQWRRKYEQAASRPRRPAHPH